VGRALPRTLDLGHQFLRTAWSIRELHEAFKRLIQQKQYPLKIYFFIDGLDEFSGDTEQLCMLFKSSCANSDSAKFCHSSRPWVQFQQSFEGCESLSLQDLTSNDINTYVNDKFYGSPAFMKLAARDAGLASSLRSEIVERQRVYFPGWK
jgi:hypothetical protein